MKIILVNSSPNKNGCTNRALLEMKSVFDKEGVQSEIFWLGNGETRGCLGCGKCLNTGRCIFNDKVNEFLEKAQFADAFVFGSPVHFANISASLSAFMDRVFYGKTRIFAHKPACGIISARRSGTTASLEAINKYFTISQMPVASSVYWNAVHGKTPEEVEQDKEGLQTVRVLAKNLVWLTKCIKEAKIAPPDSESPQKTNFIR